MRGEKNWLAAHKKWKAEHSKASFRDVTLARIQELLNYYLAPVDGTVNSNVAKFVLGNWVGIYESLDQMLKGTSNGPRIMIIDGHAYVVFRSWSNAHKASSLLSAETLAGNLIYGVFSGETLTNMNGFQVGGKLNREFMSRCVPDFTKTGKISMFLDFF